MEKNFEDWPKKKKEVIEATIHTIARDGFHRATTAKIAKNAGVGEGTIYRYFKNKDELIYEAAMHTGRLVFGPARKNYDTKASIHSQFNQFVTDLLRTGFQHQVHHRFLEQYINSPLGIAYRKKMLEEVVKNPDLQPLIYPLNRILHQAMKQEVVKDLPLQVLVALTMGPLFFLLKHESQGFMDLNNDNIVIIAKSCWDAVRR